MSSCVLKQNSAQLWGGAIFVEPGCTDECSRFSRDGDCDDGGPGSQYSLCDFGTDCTDCGQNQMLDNTHLILDNTELTANHAMVRPSRLPPSW